MKPSAGRQPNQAKTPLKVIKRRWWTLALWAVCLTPTWAAIASNPTTFWQTFSVGCLQIVFGLVAVAGTAIMHDL